MKNKWLLYIVLFALAINAAMVSVNLYQNSVQKKMTQVDGEQRHNKKKTREARFDKHLAEVLNLNDEQHAQVKEYRDSFMQVRKVERQKMRELRDQYFDLLSDEEPDTNLLNNVADEIGVLEVHKLKLEYEYYQALKSVCDVEQARLLDSIGKVHKNKHYRLKAGEDCRRKK